MLETQDKTIAKIRDLHFKKNLISIVNVFVFSKILPKMNQQKSPTTFPKGF
jgi:hypothetical protein